MAKRVLREAKIETEETLYKNSEKAWSEEEEGNPNEDVVVVDKFGNKQVAFKWTRKKSNENIKDTGTGKEGFSFYYARYVFTDPNLYKSDVLAEIEEATGVIGRTSIKDRPMLVVNSVEESTDTIRIISAYYADAPKYELFVNKYWERVKRGVPNRQKNVGAEKVYSIMAGKMPESVRKTVKQFLKKRELSHFQETAELNKNTTIDLLQDFIKENFEER
jgi:uncharacterized DUF497 family protein